MNEQRESYRAILEQQFGIRNYTLERIPIGENSENFRCRRSSYPDVFVKVSTANEAQGIRQSIRRSNAAKDCGVRTVNWQTASTKEYVVVSGANSVCCSDWSMGHLATDAWSKERAGQTGLTLATLHGAWRQLFGAQAAVPAAEWLSTQSVKIGTAVRTGLSWVEKNLETSPNTENHSHYTAVREHLERRQHLADEAIRVLGRSGMGLLHEQELHGDFSVMNLLFPADDVPIVTDFSATAPGLIEYELGRIAFPPQFVSTDVNWRRHGGWLVDAYAARRPRDSAASLYKRALTVFGLTLASSLYGMGHLQEEELDTRHPLVRFWWQRCRAVENILQDLIQGDNQ